MLHRRAELFFAIAAGNHQHRPLSGKFAALCQIAQAIEFRLQYGAAPALPADGQHRRFDGSTAS